MKNKAVFFDRDGIINKRILGDYVKIISDFELNPEIPEILKFVKDRGFLAIIISNQQGVGKGIMSKKNLDDVHNYMQNLLLQKSGVAFDDIYVCTELASSDSFNRKPNPGMILSAAEKYNIDLHSSIMIGDTDSDILAARNAGVCSILVAESQENSNPDYYISELNNLLILLKKILPELNNA
ncbi:MAG: HAD family hydrolase [Candidatus Kapabacteria bacterium]|nr:HAD family hydrolase [Ignavibacteriota bacterium]MCW5883959.1 HAD family hydrolase [Candidatus Kapabacteria bacterium]